MSDVSVDQRVAAIKQRITASQQGQARAQHGHEVATAEAQAAAKALRDEFGVNSVEDAQHLLADLKANVDNAMAEVESFLSRNEAT